MRLKTLILLAVAGTCGLVAMMGVQQILSTPAEGKSEVTKVLVAKAEILPGQQLDDRNVEFKEWPADHLPEGAIVKAEQLKERTLKVRLFPGDFISEIKLDKKGARNASSDVPKGMRVASVPIDPTMTGAGLIHPGDKVDVLVTYGSRGARDQGGIGKEIKTVLECIEVFAIDGQRDKSVLPAPTTPTPQNVQIKNVSLLVNLEQAKLLKLADDVGELHLTLRSNDDNSSLDGEAIFDPHQADVEKVVVEEEKPGPFVQALPVEKPEPKKKMWKIEIFKGTDKQTEELDLPESADSAPVIEPANQKKTAA